MCVCIIASLVSLFEGQERRRQKNDACQIIVIKNHIHEYEDYRLVKLRCLSLVFRVHEMIK